jgi:hypothetical protein
MCSKKMVYHHFINMFLNKFLSYNDPSSLIVKGVKNGREVFYSFYGERFENKVKLDWSNPCRDHLCSNIFEFGSINGAHILSLHLRIIPKLHCGHQLPKQASSFLPSRLCRWRCLSQILLRIIFTDLVMTML